MIVYDKKVASVVHPHQPMAQETLVIGANPPKIKLPPTQDELRFFGLSYATYRVIRNETLIEKDIWRFLLIVFDLERTNQLNLLPDKDLVDLFPLIESYQVTKSLNSFLMTVFPWKPSDTDCKCSY
jgi:hypothetical protein